MELEQTEAKKEMGRIQRYGKGHALMMPWHAAMWLHHGALVTAARA